MVLADARAAHIQAAQRAGSRYKLALPRRAPSGLAGLQLSQRAGSSLEYREYREYQPGDDPRFIDWAAYARSDRLMVKLFHEEVSPHLDLVIDGSRSMALAGSAKADATVALAAALAAAADRAGFTRSVHVAGEGCDPLPRGEGRVEGWADVPFDGAQPLDAALHRRPPRWRARGVRVLLSDLLFMGEPRATLTAMARGSSAVHVVQLLADADAQPPQRGNVRLVDSEGGAARELFIDAAAQRRYQRRLERHQAHWRAAARSLGATMTTLLAEPLVEHWNLGPLVESGVLSVE